MERQNVSRTFKIYERNGFIISRTAGADAPWRGWRNGESFRANTLKGALVMAASYPRA